MSEGIPEGWKMESIGHCCDILDSKRIPLNSQERARRKGIYPYYGANGVQDYINDYIFDGESVLLAEDGGNFDQWDSRPIAYLVSGKYWVNNHAHILQARNGNSTQWVYYNLVHKNILKYINGGTRAKLNQADMREIEIPLATQPEQQKIASILTSVDVAIEKTEAQISKLQDLKKGMMQELLTKGIGHTEFKDSPVGRIPKEWEIAIIGDLSDFVTSGSRGWAQYYSTNGALFIRIGNLTREHINLRFEDTVHVNPPNSAEGKRTRVQPGDILISITADLGIVGIANDQLGEAYVNQHIALVRLKDKETVNPRWVGHYLSTKPSQEQFIANNDSGAKAGLNLTSIRRIRAALPPKKEQDRISEILDSVDANIKEKRNRLAVLTRIKKALMQDLLTGKVRVKVN